MATKMKTPVSEQSNYLFYEQVETPEGTFTLSLSRDDGLDTLTKYQQKLMQVRGIPLDTTNIDPRNPVLEIIKKQMPFLNKTERVDYLRGYYQNLEADARQAAAMLAVFADQSNVMTRDPEPYKNTTLPGLEDDLPEPPKNLNHPLERRLKQIVDLLNRQEKSFEGLLGRLADAMNGGAEETDEDGFRH